MSYPVEYERLKELRDKVLAVSASIRQLQCLLTEALKLIEEVLAELEEMLQ